jgi:Outer membrane protein beta-barrel domain
MQYLLRKQIILLVGLLSISLASIAQRDEVYRPYNDEKPVYLGLNIGLTSGYMNFERGAIFSNPGNDIANSISPIFNKALVMGLSGTLRLNDHFLLRVNPNILITGTKDIFYYKKNNSSDNSKMSIPSTIINLPIALKLESDRYNFFKMPNFMRHYVFTGVKFDYDFSASKDANGTTNGNLESTYSNLLNAADYGYEFGLGVSFYFPYATISPEIKFSYGQRDMIYSHESNQNKLLRGLDKLTSNFVYFTIHVEGESFFLKN